MTRAGIRSADAAPRLPGDERWSSRASHNPPHPTHIQTKHRFPHGSPVKRTWVPEHLRIVHRSEKVQQRLVPGHWEGDLIKGAFNRSCVATLVERKTRFVILCKMDGCTAEAALECFSRQLKKLPESMRTSLTCDRGTELTCCPELMDRLDIDVWFADPHAPWQRGSNENTNGLLRQFLPKGIDLSSASHEYLNHVEILMNTRPRQTLGWKTPAEVMNKEIAEFRSRVALAS